MRKLLFIIFILIFSFACRAEFKYLLEISRDFQDQSRPYAASFYLKKHLSSHKSKKFHTNYEHVLSLIDLVGYGVFDDLSLFDTKVFPFAAMHYHSLKYLIFNGKYKKAMSAYKKAPSIYQNHPVFLQLYGFATYQLGRKNESLTTFKKCVDRSRKVPTPHFMSKRNYHLIIQQCNVYLAREYYRHGQFQASLFTYDKVDEKSYYYPHAFIERAWNHYQLNQYDEVLGLNLAFNASWLSPFYTGEIDLVATLALIKLCRWDDVFYFISQLHLRSNRMIAHINKVEFYLENHLDDFLEKNKKYLQKLPLESRKVLSKFQLNTYWEKIYSEYIQIKKEIKNPQKNITDQIDINRIQKFLITKQKEIIKKIRTHMMDELGIYREKLYLAKEKADGLELEILARYRNTIYQNDENLESLAGVKKDKKKKTDKIKQEKIKWKFNREKWRDEIGKYSVKLPSQCGGKSKELSL